MSQILTVARPHTTKDLQQSDSSSQFSIKSNKERMKEFKILSLKKNSVMEHLLGYRTDKTIAKQSSVLFHSQKWNLEPILSKNKKEELTNSTASKHDNPFFQAKQNLYQKQKVSDNSRQNKKYIDEPLENMQLNDQRITFRRLVKKNSANQSLRGYQKEQ